jgi:hypothetical protein
MSINNYSKSSHPHSTQGKVFQQVFHSNGSFHLNQFRETEQSLNDNTLKDDTTRDETLKDKSFSKPPEDSTLQDKAIDSLDLLNCEDNFIEHLNQDSDEFTNDDQSFDNNIHLRDDPDNGNAHQKTLNRQKKYSSTGFC